MEILAEDDQAEKIKMWPTLKSFGVWTIFPHALKKGTWEYLLQVFATARRQNSLAQFCGL